MVTNWYYTRQLQTGMYPAAQAWLRGSSAKPSTREQGTSKSKVITLLGKVSATLTIRIPVIHVTSTMLLVFDASALKGVEIPSLYPCSSDQVRRSLGTYKRVTSLPAIFANSKHLTSTPMSHLTSREVLAFVIGLQLRRMLTAAAATPSPQC